MYTYCKKKKPWSLEKGNQEANYNYILSPKEGVLLNKQHVSNVNKKPVGSLRIFSASPT